MYLCVCPWLCSRGFFIPLPKTNIIWQKKRNTTTTR
nr:MAG TPA: hypothetical protein [Caudoviricetes sp.]